MPSFSRLRVLFLASRDPEHPEAGGGDILLSALAEHLAKRGHVVTYTCIGRPGAAAEEVRNAVRILRGGDRLTQALWAAWMYKRSLVGQVDAVIEEAVGGLRVPYLAPLYVWRPLIAFWYQDHAPLLREEFAPPVAAVLVYLERRLARLHRRAVIATPSAFQAERLQRLGFRPQQIHVVPCGLDWPIVPPPQLAAREPLVVYLGKLRRYKCPHHLLDVAERLRAAVPGIRIVIAGRPDGTGFDRWIEAQIRQRGLHGEVAVRRSIGEAEKRGLLRRARVLVLPSPTEGFGIAALEAHWCGTPTVVTDGVPTEVVRHGVNGLRVAFGNREQLAAAVYQLLTDDLSWVRMSLAAWAMSQQFTWSNGAAKLEQLIADSVGSTTEAS